MALSPNQLAVNKSAGAAETVAAAIADAARSMQPATAVEESARRQLLKHARELCDLHDELDHESVMRAPGAGADSMPTLAAYRQQSEA